MDKEKDLKDIVEEVAETFEGDAPSAPDLHVDLDTGAVTQNENSPLKWGETDMPEVPKVEIPTWEAPIQEEPIQDEPVLEFSSGIEEEVAAVESAAAEAEKPLNTTEQWIKDREAEKAAQAQAQANAAGAAGAGMPGAGMAGEAGAGTSGGFAQQGYTYQAGTPGQQGYTYQAGNPGQQGYTYQAGTPEQQAMFNGQQDQKGGFVGGAFNEAFDDVKEEAAEVFQEVQAAFKGETLDSANTVGGAGYRETGNRGSNLAVPSLVLGILSLICALFGYSSFLGVILAIVGTVLGAKARKMAQTGVATGGFICSIVGLILNGIAIACVVACLGTIGAAGLLSGF